MADVDLTGVTNFFPRASRTYANNLSGTISAGAGTVPVNNTAPFVDGDIVVLMVDRNTASEAVFTGQKSGGGFINCIWTEGNLTASHSTGATVEDIDSATHFDMVVKGVRQTLNQDGSIKANAPAAGFTEAVTGQGVTVNNVALGGSNPALAVGTDTYKRTGHTPYKSVATTTSPANVLEQMGFNYIQGNNTNLLAKPITFPTTFDTILGIQVTNVGGKTGSAPNDPTECTSASTEVVSSYISTTSGFTAVAASRDASANIPTTFYVGFFWRAFGVKA